MIPNTNEPESPDSNIGGFLPSQKLSTGKKSKARGSPLIPVDSALSGPSSTVAGKKPHKRTKVYPSQGDAVLISFLAPDQHDIAITAGLNPLYCTSESDTTEAEMGGGSGSTDLDGGCSANESKRPSTVGVNVKDGPKESNSITTPVDTGDANTASTDIPAHINHTTNVDPAQSPEPIVLGVEPVIEQKPAECGDSGHIKIREIEIDPELVKQSMQDLEIKIEETDQDAMEITGSSETAASLITLAGGAINQYLWAQGVDPSSPELASKNLAQPLPSLMGPGSPTSRDGKHTKLPPLNSIDVLAELATKQESPQQQGPNPVQSPSVPPRGPGSPGFTDVTTRPPLQHMTAQQRQHFMGIDSSAGPGYYPHHQPHYPPIKDTTTGNPQQPYQASSPQTTYQTLSALVQSSTPDSANLFARDFGSQTAGLGGRRGSSSTELQYGSDQATSQVHSTGETLPGSGPGSPPVVTTTTPRNQRGNGALAGGGFKCEYGGCKAPPFQTQYLLNSHANVHSSARPHYCPVKGCARGEGGKGFKRKNEMIRHGLVHDSPGYICPFCPDREHKYPRPDNLQRHVRVHHVDKDKDDPLLRDVLSQRPEGGTRGRRRRIGA